MMNKNGKNFKNKKSTSNLSFFFIGILFLCFDKISTDNVGGSLMSLASPGGIDTSALFVNPIQKKIDQTNALNKLMIKNGNFLNFFIFFMRLFNNNFLFFSSFRKCQID